MQINYSNFLEFIVSNRWKSKSQISQDLFVLYFTQQKKNGYFIEIGACDGKHLSNSFALEKRGWTGIICEPSNFWLQKMKNRKSKTKALRIKETESNLRNVFQQYSTVDDDE